MEEWKIDFTAKQVRFRSVNLSSMTDNILTVDVCEDIRNGREPFSKIMRAVAVLADGQDLLLIAPSEPLPLFGVMAKQGFQHRSRPVSEGKWEVLFSFDGRRW